MMLQLKYSAGQDNATGRDCMAGDDWAPNQDRKAIGCSNAVQDGDRRRIMQNIYARQDEIADGTTNEMIQLQFCRYW